MKLVGKALTQEEKGSTEDMMVGWNHRLNRHEFDQSLGYSEEEGSMAHSSPWGLKEADRT